MRTPEPTYSGGQPEPRHDRQHPDFTSGNLLGLRHGAFSDRLVRPRALEIAHGLADDGALPAYLAEPRYRPAVMAYAMTLARLERVESYLEGLAAEGVPPELEADGTVKAATGLVMALERAADRHRDRLGLSPLAAARLGRDVAASQVSLSLMWAEGGGVDGGQ